MQLKEAGKTRKVISKVAGVSIMNVELCNQGRSDLSQSVALSCDLMVSTMISSRLLTSNFDLVLGTHSQEHRLRCNGVVARSWLLLFSAPCSGSLAKENNTSVASTMIMWCDRIVLQLCRKTLGVADRYLDACGQSHLTACIGASQTPQSAE